MPRSFLKVRNNANSEKIAQYFPRPDLVAEDQARKKNVDEVQAFGYRFLELARGTVNSNTSDEYLTAA